jgi:hypothetical protein
MAKLTNQKARDANTVNGGAIKFGSEAEQESSTRYHYRLSLGRWASVIALVIGVVGALFLYLLEKLSE